MPDLFESTYKPLQNGSDVRGIAITAGSEQKNLTPEIAAHIAGAFVTYLARKTAKSPEALRIGVGHDSRLTAGELKSSILRGLAPASVFDCGLVSTPAVFLSTVLPQSHFDGALMITASHLPFNRNGIKFFTRDGGLEASEVKALLQEAAVLAAKVPERTAAKAAPAVPFDLVGLYSEHMKQLIRTATGAAPEDLPLSGLHIAADAGNGAAGFFASRILEPLGADISGSVFLEPDGHFPNHIPNPENAGAMKAISSAVTAAKADLGVIFDCDGDRAAVVFSDGSPVNRNALIALLSAILAEEHPGCTVVTDSVTSDELAVFLTEQLQLKHLRFKRGYKNVIDKGQELNREGIDCELAIETSGHGALKENYFSDDGAYLCVKIIAQMANMKKQGRRIEELIETLGAPAEAEEIRFHITGSDFAAYGASVLEDFRAFAAAHQYTIVEPNYEGIRLSFRDPEVRGWVLLRMSLHDPVMPMNLEASSAGGTAVILRRLQPFFAAHSRLER